MGGKTLILFVFILLVALPVVSAYDTLITVKSYDYHDVNIIVLQPTEEYGLIKSHNNIYTGNKGSAFVTHSSEDSTFKLRIIVKKDGAIIENMAFDGPYNAGTPIELIVPDNLEELLEEEEEDPVEEPVEEEEEDPVEEEEEVTTEEENQEAAAIAGNVISDEENDGGLSKILYWAFGVLILAGIVGFVMGKVIRARRVKLGLASPKESKFKLKKGKEEGYEYKKQLEDAEKKLKEAQSEINKVKNQDKIKDAEKKLDKDREDLEKLRRGDE